MATAEEHSYSMEVYLEMCDKMIESVVSHLEYREFEKHMALQDEDKWKKSAMRNYCEQLRKYLREQLRQRFEQVAQQHGLEDYLRACFDAQQKTAVIESLGVVSTQLRTISLRAYYEMMEATAQKILETAAAYDADRRDRPAPGAL